MTELESQELESAEGATPEMMPTGNQLAIKVTTIGIVAGELSGDTLGAGLIKAIKEIRPDIQFVGIGGPKMMEQGCKSLYDLEDLSVMGLVEVIGRLGTILKIRSGLLQYFKLNPPDLFIGIDAPDFNLPIEKRLKSQEIKTIHYVSPSVWAWRPERIKTISKATDLVLSVLPFEKEFYDRHQVPCTFVGHTLADQVPILNDQRSAQYRLQLDPTKRWIAVLPGSRVSEVEKMAEPFLKTCLNLYEKSKDYRFIVPLVNQKVREKFEAIKAKVAPNLSVLLLDSSFESTKTVRSSSQSYIYEAPSDKSELNEQHVDHSYLSEPTLSREVMTASDVVLLASGTATLECLLVKRPMVVAYKANTITYYVGKKLFQLPHFSLPNIIAGKAVVAEFLQDQCDEAYLTPALAELLESDNQPLLNQFCQIHLTMRCNADQKAAKAVLALL